MQKNLTFFLLFCFFLIGCSKSANEELTVEDNFIRAADMSFLVLAESENAIYKHNNIAQDPLLTLKNSGCNTIRIRLWNNPITSTSSFQEVTTLAYRAKQLGLKVWLSVHYSDTWADPANQIKPVAWQNYSFTELKNALQSYTHTIATTIKPDIFQIGNETNDGFLFPEGKLSTNLNQYLELVQIASTTVRNASPNTKIMLHYAGILGANYYFNQVNTIDYDYIGLSYYPVWHGNDLSALEQTINFLGQTHQKKVLIAETAYPFTLSWNDMTNNIVGLNNQLVANYPATAIGQKDFLLKIKSIVKTSDFGIGFCYWGGEWTAFRGYNATNGSPWENQALWDFNNNSLPVFEAFSQY